MNIDLSPHSRPCLATARRQAGFVLPFVVLVLLILMGLSASFFNRTVDSAVFSGAAKDYTQALLLAESGANLLYGQFVMGRDLVGNPASFAPNAKADNEETWFDVNQPFPDPYPVAYLFYATAGGGVDKSSPTILQRVANGEAQSASTDPLGSRAIPDGTALRVNSLFVSPTVRPVLYVRGPNGFVASGEASWLDESSAEKVAMWIEATRPNPARKWVYIYVCSAAQVGQAKAYVQRYAGSYKDQTLGDVPPLVEAANHQ